MANHNFAMRDAIRWFKCKLKPPKKLPDETYSSQPLCSPLPDVTSNLGQDATDVNNKELPDETNLLELLCNSLPDATTTLGQDATDAADSVILDAMIKYPLSVNNNKELPDKTAKDQEKLATSELPDITESEQAQLPNTDSPEGNVHASTENSSMSGVSTVDKRNDNDVSNVDTDNNVSHNLLENSIPHESTNEKSDASKLKDCII